MMRRPTSLLGRLARVVLAIIAAGAGWFAFERLVLDRDVDADRVSPWATSSSGDEWTSFVFTSSDGERRQVVSHDGNRQITRLESRPNDDQQPNQTIELAGADGWERSADGEWTRVPPSVLGDHTVTSLSAAIPIRVTDAFPEPIHGFVTVDDDRAVGDVHRYEFSVDAAGFAEAAPIAFARWIDSRPISGLVDRESATQSAPVLKMDVRPDGYIVRWSGVGGEELTWTDLGDPIALESPAGSGA